MNRAEELFCAVLVGILLGISIFLGLSETIWKRVQVVVPYAHVLPCGSDHVNDTTTQGGRK